MNIRVVCGNDDCRKEFSADTEEPEWICQNCDRVIKNPHFPFLTARVMHSRFRPEDVDWEELLDRLLIDINKHFDGVSAILADGDKGAKLCKDLGDEGVQMVKEADDDVDALRTRYGKLHGDDPQKMHEALLKDAREAATRLYELTRVKSEKAKQIRVPEKTSEPPHGSG
jgi:hypothetical protein